jgi:hypothetical protein
MFCFAEVELSKVVRKKMDPLANADDDYSILDELLAVGNAAQTLAVCPKTLTVTKTNDRVELVMPEDSYVLPE